jgi:hypothetical protein
MKHLVLFCPLIAIVMLTACAAPPPRQLAQSEFMTNADATPANIFYVAPDGDDGNPGTQARPWLTVNKAAAAARAGDVVLIRGGIYKLEVPVLVLNSGTPQAWITFKSYPGEKAVIDAAAIDRGAPKIGMRFSHDNGAFQVHAVQYVRVENLHVRNSRGAGISVRDSSYVDIIGNHTENTYSSGISVWDTNHDAKGTEYIRVLSNTVTRANTFDMLPTGNTRQSEAPHEAISIGGAAYFEVAYNHVYDVDKEGIDVKEVSRHGKVHHNLVERADRQGLYVDAWFGELEDIEIYENVVRNCRGAGFAISVEGGEALRNVRFHHNLLYDNLGTGILFARWGGDGPRGDIRIYNNTLHRNGHGPASSTGYFWITGGIYLYSANLEDVEIRDNILSANRGFQIGYSDHWLKYDGDGERALQSRRISVHHNLFFGTDRVTFPIRVGWPPNDYANVFGFAGEAAVEADPQFVAPAKGDFRLRAGSPAVGAGSDGGTIGALAPMP